MHNTTPKGKGKVGNSPHVHYKNLADDAVALQILDEIEKDPNISQGKIVNRTGLAAGLVHSFMNKVISKGWVRVKQVSAKRWLYFMTPDGFLEKGRLTMYYLTRELRTYKKTQAAVLEMLQGLLRGNVKKLAVYGNSELAEIVVLNIKAMNTFELVAVASETSDVTLVGVEVVDVEALRELEFDKLLRCDSGSQFSRENNLSFINSEKILDLTTELLGSNSYNHISE